MSVEAPKFFWEKISTQKDWINYILPNRTNEQFYKEGRAEAERLYYFVDFNKTIVDYGCGIGRVTGFVSERAKSVVGLDINFDFVNKARKLNKDKHNLEFYVADKYKKVKVADFLYCLMVLQHNDERNRKLIMNQIVRLLKVGGTCLIQFPKAESDYYIESPFVHKFTKKEVQEYAAQFGSYHIIEGNLVNYAGPIREGTTHEYFLIGKK